MRALIAAALFASCSEMQPPPPPPDPPHVFVVAPESNVVGDRIVLNVNVTGCAAISQLQVLQGKTVIKTTTTNKASTQIEVIAGDVAAFYNSLGIAADLTLSAKAICD